MSNIFDLIESIRKRISDHPQITVGGDAMRIQISAYWSNGYAFQQVRSRLEIENIIQPFIFDDFVERANIQYEGRVKNV